MTEKKEPNPKGPIFIPKRMGIGWTLNFERVESFWILGGFIVALVVFVLIKNGTIKF